MFYHEIIKMHDLVQLYPTQMAYWSKNYATALARVAHSLIY